MALNLKTTRTGHSLLSTPFYPEESVDLTEDDDNEAPVDLSQLSGRHSQKTTPPEEVMTFKSQEEKLRLIEELRNELKNEETALILMKKLKFSCDKGSVGSLSAMKKDGQRLNCNFNNNSQNINNSNIIRKNILPRQQQQQPNRNQQQQQQVSNKSSNNVYKRSAYPQQQNSIINNNNNSNNSFRPQSNSTINNSNNNKMQQYSNYLSNQASKTNGIISNNNTTSQQQKFLQEQQRKMLQQQQQAASIIVEQTAAQKLAAAKLAVSKQLEQSLQQLPSLVTTPFDLILIPSSNHLDYTASVGLEAVVNHLLQAEETSATPEPPKECGLCGCDYTTKWVARKDAKVWCEACYRKDKKKLVAKQQEERIGVLLMRAVTQEKNIEKALALELEAARQQIEAFNSTLATAVSTPHNSPINHSSPHRSLDNQRTKSRHNTTNAPSSSSHNKARHSKPPHDSTNHHHNNPQSSSSSSTYKNHSIFFPNDLERLMMNKDKVLGNYLSLINPSAFIPSSSSSTSSSHHPPLRSHKPYSRPQ